MSDSRDKFDNRRTYTPIPVCSTIWGALYDLASDESSEYVEYYGFDVLQVPDEIISRDKQLLALGKIHPFTAGITRMQPDTVYNWHTDDNRHGTINMMIHSEHSHCLFTTDAEARVSETKELIYQRKTYYIFNTQIPHMVANLSGHRFMLTLEFRDKVTYKDLIDFFTGRTHE
jgi:hypothetical protein